MRLHCILEAARKPVVCKPKLIWQWGDWGAETSQVGAQDLTKGV